MTLSFAFQIYVIMKYTVFRFYNQSNCRCMQTNTTFIVLRAVKSFRLAEIQRDTREQSPW